MIEFSFDGRSEDLLRYTINGESKHVDVSFRLATKIAESVGDPHLLLSNGDEIGLTQSTQIVSIATGIDLEQLGIFAMRENPTAVYKMAGEVLMLTLPREKDAPEVDGKKG